MLLSVTVGWSEYSWFHDAMSVSVAARAVARL